MKICSKCKTPKELDLFSNSKQNKDGKHGWCKECLYSKNDVYHKGHLKEINVADKLRRDKLRLDVIAAYGGQCECCAVNVSQFLTVDHVAGGGKAHRKKIHNNFYEYLRRNNYPKAEFRLLCMNCNHAIGHVGKCPHTGYKHLYTPRYGMQRELVFSSLGAHCVCCLEENTEFLAVDHINGGGRKHLLTINMNICDYLYTNRSVPEIFKDYQILCHNCNFSKGIYGYCPHSRSVADVSQNKDIESS